jgi:RNA 3'-terminal phosphate cyclase
LVWKDIIAARATSRDTIFPKLGHSAALAQSTSRYRIPRLTEHVETNLWLIESILGAKTKIGKVLMVEIEDISY